MFKATNTFNESIYDKYIGTDVVSDPTEEHLSLDSTCSSGCWYKHPLVENWSNVNINEVSKMYLSWVSHLWRVYFSDTELAFINSPDATDSIYMFRMVTSINLY